MKVLTPLLTICMLCITLAADGQRTLTTDEAIALAIENNHGVQLAKNRLLAAENNTDKRGLGYNPTIDASIGPNATFGGSSQVFGNGTEARTSNALSWDAGGAINARYDIYNPSRSIQLGQLKEILDLSNLQLRQTIENTIIQVYNQYYNIALLTENLKALQEALALSSRRLERAKTRSEMGQGLSLDILNAQVDLRRDSVEYLNINQQIANTKRDLELLLGGPMEEDFNIDPNVEYLSDLSLDELMDHAMTHNVNLLLSQQNQVINQYDLDIIRSLNKPIISTNAGINYNYSVGAPGSFIKTSINSGINLGVTLSWNLWDGGRRKVQEQNTQIAMESEVLSRDQISSQLQRDISNAWGDYRNSLYILQVEQKSRDVSIQNLNRTTDLYDRGQVSSVDFRQAQLNVLNAEVGYNTARYQAKLIELELLYQSGDIMNLER